MSTRAIQIEFLLAGLINPTTQVPLDGGKVYFYEAGTTTAKNVWTEKEKTNAYTYITLATGGYKQIYGDGIYKLLVYDSSDSLIYTFDNIKVRADNYSVSTKTAAYTATTDDDVILVNTSSGAVTITMPAAADMEYPITIIHTTGTNAVTIEPNGSETIDGASNYSFTSTGTSITAISNGSNLIKGGSAALTLMHGATITLANTGLHLLDSNASHDLIIKPGSNLTADKTLTITTGDSDRTLTLSGNATLNQDVSSTADPTFNTVKINDSNDSHTLQILCGEDLTADRTCEIEGVDGNFCLLTGDAGTTVMLFGNNSAPSGWTRKADWQDTAMLCYAASGDCGSGGSANPQSTHTHAAGSYANPNHVHNLKKGSERSNKDPSGECFVTESGGLIYQVEGTGSTSVYYSYTETDSDGGAGVTGTSAANTAPYYQEVIAATKD